jgi:hypothetical protein
MMLIMVLIATYITIAAFGTLGFSLLMRRTKANVAAVWRAEEWRETRATRPASTSSVNRKMVGAGSHSE